VTTFARQEKDGKKTRNEMTVPKLELLFSPGCAAIEGTVKTVSEVLRELDLAAEVSEIMVDTEEKARQFRFLGSPSIRANGHDIEPGAHKRPDYGLG
jgi:hypothetical protein